MHEMEEMKRAQELRVDEVCEKRRHKSRDNSTVHFPIVADATTNEFYG